jgi:FkbM family methyltransferase
MRIEVMKPHKVIAKAFGYELVKRGKHPTSNSHLINLINHNNIDVVLDVGANNGRFGLMLRNEGYEGEIHSFEPVSKTFENLSRACLNDKKWFPNKVAMGSVVGEETVHITESSDLSSFLNPNDFGKEIYKKIKVSQTEIVNVSTIDDYLTTRIANFERRNILLKMDTQGYDLKVFEGALNNLEYIDCILSEISLIPIYTGMPHYLDALRKYEKHGFIVTGLYPISRKSDLSVIEMDCFMINSKI